MFRRLRRRLTAVCTAATVIILIGMACASLYISERNLRQWGPTAFRGSLNAALYHLSSQTTVLSYAWLAQTESEGGLMIDLVDNGRPLLYPGVQDRALRERLFALARETALREYGYDSTEPPDTALAPQALQFTLEDGGERYYAALAAVPVRSGWLDLCILKSKGPEERQVLLLRWAFAGLVVLASALLAGFSWLFTARAVRPVEEARRRQTEFVAAASHELRAPLAVIRASAGTLPGAPPKDAARFAGVISEECARLSRLVEDMLTLAGSDSGSWSVVREDCDLQTLALDAAESFEQAAAARGARLAVELPEDPLPPCRCDPQRIGQVLSILLDNALAYAGKGGRIALSAGTCREGVFLRVADDGPGVPDSQKARVFDRFYRADSARGGRAHYGLGLSIALEIARLHHGSLSLTDTPGGGATFTLTLPRGT